MNTDAISWSADVVMAMTRSIPRPTNAMSLLCNFIGNPALRARVGGERACGFSDIFPREQIYHQRDIPSRDDLRPKPDPDRPEPKT
jgi:hypothetical protein